MPSAAPLPWQPPAIAAVEAALRANQAFLDASDTGTGKTYVTLFAAKAAQRRLAVICPLAAIPAWREAADKVGVPTLFVRNVESLKAEKPPQHIRKFGRQWQWRLPPDVVPVFDEVHRFAGASTDNAKILAAAPPAVMLSATVANSPLQLRAIGSQLGLTRWGEWWGWCLKNGCRPGDFGGLKFVGGQPVLDRLHRQIFHAGRGVRVRVADLKGIFPENSIEVVGVPVDRQEALDEAYAQELELLQASAVGVLPELLRARQMSEHLKLPAMIEMAEDGLAEGHSVALFVNFRDTLERLASHRWATGWAAVIHGDQTKEEREAARYSFQHDLARVIVLMIQAGGITISLQDIFGVYPRLGLLFPGWSARELIQALGRLPRAGAKTNVIQRLLFADGTVEDSMRKKVLAKKRDIELLNDGALVDSDLRVTV